MLFTSLSRPREARILRSFSKAEWPSTGPCAVHTLPTFLVSLFGSSGNFNQMKTELRLYGAVNLSKVSAEDNVIKFFDHLA